MEETKKEETTVTNGVFKFGVDENIIDEHTENDADCDEIITKEDVFELVSYWLSNDMFTTPTEVKKKYGELSFNTVERLCLSRELSFTSIPKLLLVGDRANNEVFNAFQKLCDAKRIMTSLEAKVQLNLPTLHRLHKAVKRGILYRVEFHDAIIYIQ